jgi:hypothetical protein
VWYNPEINRVIPLKYKKFSIIKPIMKKTFILTLSFILITSANLLAQTLGVDSVISIAKEDGRKFRLTPQQKERFKADKKNSGSDLFKPNAGNVSDVSLLKDTLYVRTFRMAAYKRNRHTTWHYVLWYGAAAYLVACIIDFAVLNPAPDVPAPGSKID